MSILIESQELKIEDVGVDWLTCSRQGDAAFSSFSTLAVTTLEETKRQGVPVRPASFRGYTGLRAGSVFYGTSGSDALCILGGGHPLPLVREFIDNSTNVSRIDLQLTVRRALPDKALGRITYLQASEGGLSRGCKPIVQRIHNTKYGDTVSIGSRVSDMYGRAYDKGVQAKTEQPGILHRFEVEYKRTQALHHAAEILKSSKPLDAIKSSVLDWWRTRGVDPLPGESARYLIDILPQTLPKPDLLKWFDTKVKQSVATAIRDHGLRETLDALGLLDVLINYKED